MPIFMKKGEGRPALPCVVPRHCVYWQNEEGGEFPAWL